MVVLSVDNMFMNVLLCLHKSGISDIATSECLWSSA